MQTRQILALADAVARTLRVDVDPVADRRARRARHPVVRSPVAFAADIAQLCSRLGMPSVARPATAAEVSTAIGNGTLPLVLTVPDEFGCRGIVVRTHAAGRLAITQVGIDGTPDDEDVTLPELLALLAGHTIGLVAVTSAGAAMGSDDASQSPLGRLWRLLGHERRLVTSIWVYAALAGLFGLALPLGVQAIIGLVSGGLILQPVVLLIAFVIAGTLATGVLQLLQLSVVETIQQRVFARYALDLTARVSRVRLDQVAGLDLPELMNRFFEVKTIQKSLGKLLTDWVAAGLQVVFGLLLLTLYHPFFALFGLALVGGLAAIFRWTAPRGWVTSLGESRSKYRVAHWLEELAFATRTLRFAGNSSLPLDRTDGEVGTYVAYRAAHFRVLVGQSAAFVAFKTLVTGGLLVLGCLLVVNRQITLGQFVASELVIVTVLFAVEKLIFGLADVYDILTALEKAGHASALPQEVITGAGIVTARDPRGAAVQLRDVHFGFEAGGAAVLTGASLDVGPGERVALAGPHGGGTSTLLAVAAGLYPGYQGAALLDGTSWRDLDLAHARADIGWCGQDAELFEGTIEENISLGRPDIRTEQVLEALARVGLADWLAALPDGLQTEVRAEGRVWPRNVIARLEVARAIVASPRLVAVDRMLDALDPADRQALADVLLAPARGWTTIVATQADDLMARCDRTLSVVGGRVTAWGGAPTVMTPRGEGD